MFIPRSRFHPTALCNQRILCKGGGQKPIKRRILSFFMRKQIYIRHSILNILLLHSTVRVSGYQKRNHARIHIFSSFFELDHIETAGMLWSAEVHKGRTHLCIPQHVRHILMFCSGFYLCAINFQVLYFQFGYP